MTSKDPRPIRVLVVDDNPVVRTGLTTLLESGGVQVVGEASDGAQAIELARRACPDLVLLDVRMPVMDGVAAAGPLSGLAKVLMLSYDSDAEVIGAAIRNGAAGYLVHGAFGAEELVAAIADTVADRSSPLSPQASRAVVAALREGPADRHAETPAVDRRAELGLSRREAEVMDLIARGRSNGEIAAMLVVSEYTVKNHVNRIFAKLGVRARGAAIACWLGTADSPPRE
ncbi:response regulator [Actinomadura rudentiformis]|uniref:Response regulator transcription factor n=1 Tax=Actinomadura rudentiformis TaxID=359158 RepID=A0A6H9Z398_9ACTN|nr:response regulator transcription factor [Actinomadura rudentiformis]KAB2351521.1 response regulator transcription factor [Actinomadura rudentiformis]